MISAEEYRLRAEQCHRLAEMATDDYHKKNYQRLAKLWTETAHKIEDREEFSSTLASIEDPSATLVR
jgi:hypothetical protein